MGRKERRRKGGGLLRIGVEQRKVVIVAVGMGEGEGDLGQGKGVSRKDEGNEWMNQRYDMMRRTSKG